MYSKISKNLFTKIGTTIIYCAKLLTIKLQHTMLHHVRILTLKWWKSVQVLRLSSIQKRGFLSYSISFYRCKALLLWSSQTYKPTYTLEKAYTKSWYYLICVCVLISLSFDNHSFSSKAESVMTNCLKLSRPTDYEIYLRYGSNSVTLFPSYSWESEEVCTVCIKFKDQYIKTSGTVPTFESRDIKKGM